MTYDEFGGQWDHVSPPAPGSTAAPTTPGARARGSRRWSSRRSLNRSGVDHTVYDTTSILATIEHGFGLAPLSRRDAAVNDLTQAVDAGRNAP